LIAAVNIPSTAAEIHNDLRLKPSLGDDMSALILCWDGLL